MGFFSRGKKNAGMMAISFGYDGLYSACVRHELGCLPTLDFLSFYPKSNQPPIVLLERLARETPAKQKRCALLLAMNDTQLFALDGLNVPADEVKSAARWKLKELLDYSIDEASFDILPVPGDQASNGRNSTMIAVVSRSALLRQHQELFLEAKLDLSVIDVFEMAQRNISVMLEPEGRGVAMLSFDTFGGLLTVTFGSELYLSRRLEVTLLELQKDNEEVRRGFFERISLELQRSLDNFDRQHNYITTAKLMLAPLGVVAEELRAFLASNMYMPVEVLDLASVINLSSVPELKSAEKQQIYFSVIGAALRREEGAL
jgi:MSHA biogenesis protein MshI